MSVCLWFDDQAEEAAEFYTSLVPDSKIENIMRLAEDQPALMVAFTIGGIPFQVLNGGPQYQHSEAASISVSTENQEETDRLWNALIVNGGSEGYCAWLIGKFGVSWQIVPTALPKYLGSDNQEVSARVLQAMMGMKKLLFLSWIWHLMANKLSELDKTLPILGNKRIN